MDENYFTIKDIKLSVSKCCVDMLVYAMNHIDWSEYDADDFGGESGWAACVHLDDIEGQLLEQFE